MSFEQVKEWPSPEQQPGQVTALDTLGHRRGHASRVDHTLITHFDSTYLHI